MIDIIGVKLWQGSDNRGTEKAIEDLLDNNLINILKNNHNSIGNVSIIDEPFTKNIESTNKIKYFSSVISCCKGLEVQVAKSLTKKHFPLVIGGDHSLAIGSISGINHCINKEDLSVIWIDAHTDINTDDSSNSHNIHGMPVAALLGLGNNKLIDNFGLERTKIIPQNLYYIGSRSVDSGEKEIIKNLNINVFDMNTIKKYGIRKCVDMILNKVTTPYIHISFDVDFIGSEYFKATGLPVPNGPSIEETKQCLRLLFDSGKVCSMDFVEYSPRYDNDRTGLKTCLEILKFIFK